MLTANPDIGLVVSCFFFFRLLVLIAGIDDGRVIADRLEKTTHLYTFLFLNHRMSLLVTAIFCSLFAGEKKKIVHPIVDTLGERERIFCRLACMSL
jgi:hypothetical protein